MEHIINTLRENHRQWNDFSRNLVSMGFLSPTGEWWIYVGCNDLGTPYFVRPVRTKLNGVTLASKQHTVLGFDARWLLEAVDTLTSH